MGTQWGQCCRTPPVPHHCQVPSAQPSAPLFPWAVPKPTSIPAVPDGQGHLEAQLLAAAGHSSHRGSEEQVLRIPSEAKALWGAKGTRAPEIPQEASRGSARPLCRPVPVSQAPRD